MSRRTNSLLNSQLGSSLRSHSYQEMEDERSITSGPAVIDILALLPPHDRRFDNLSDASGEGEIDFAITSLAGSEDTPRFTAPPVGHFSSIHQEVMQNLKQVVKDSSCSTCSSCESCSTDIWEALGIDEAKIDRVAPMSLPEDLERFIKEEIGRLSVERPQRECSGSSGARSKPMGPAEPDNMEGLWNMLATYDEFVITPPGFNVYQQEKPHWLDQEPLPWAEREKARRKCLQWLRTQQQTTYTNGFELNLNLN